MYARVLKGAPLEFELNASNLKFFHDVAQLQPPIQMAARRTRAFQKKEPLYPEYPHVIFSKHELFSTQAYCWYTDADGKRRRLTKNMAVTADSEALGTSEEIRRSGAAFLEGQYVLLDASGVGAEGNVNEEAVESCESEEADEEGEDANAEATTWSVSRAKAKRLGCS